MNFDFRPWQKKNMNEKQSKPEKKLPHQQSSSRRENKLTDRRRNKAAGGGGTGLNDFFIAVFGLCFLLSLSLNFLHDSEAVPHSHNTVVENAMKDFKDHVGMKKKILELKKRTKQVGSDNNNNNNNNNNDRKAATTTKFAELNCDKFGGPSKELAQEMVYWEDIPSDEHFVSPFKRDGETKYMTFEPDGGGWNNIRMAMESTIGLAVAMGRTLVMPPQKQMYLLGNQKNKQKQ